MYTNVGSGKRPADSKAHVDPENPPLRDTHC